MKNYFRCSARVSRFAKSTLLAKVKLLLISFTASLFMASCSISPEVKDLDAPGTQSLNKNILTAASALSSVTSLDKVDLYLTIGSNTTGTVTVDIMDSLRTTVLGSATVPVASIMYSDPWKTFTFSPAIELNNWGKYTINVTRSDAHNYSSSNYIFWRTSSWNTNPYLEGNSDPGSYWNLDYAFKTYKSGITDQQQTLSTYAFFIGSGFYRWQEFRADFHKVMLNKVDLFLTVGASTTGTATVEIRNFNGTNILATSTVATTFLLSGSNWNSFTFATPPVLYNNNIYRIYVTRSDPHAYSSGNYIFWRTSSGGVDAYPDGVNDVYPSWTLDYAFRTYNADVLDQQQPLTNYSFFTSSNFYRWQEFSPANP